MILPRQPCRPPRVAPNIVSDASAGPPRGVRLQQNAPDRGRRRRLQPRRSVRRYGWVLSKIAGCVQLGGIGARGRVPDARRRLAVSIASAAGDNRANIRAKHRTTTGKRIVSDRRCDDRQHGSSLKPTTVHRSVSTGVIKPEQSWPRSAGRSRFVVLHLRRGSPWFKLPEVVWCRGGARFGGDGSSLGWSGSRRGGFSVRRRALNIWSIGRFSTSWRGRNSEDGDLCRGPMIHLVARSNQLHQPDGMVALSADGDDDTGYAEKAIMVGAHNGPAVRVVSGRKVDRRSELYAARRRSVGGSAMTTTTGSLRNVGQFSGVDWSTSTAGGSRNHRDEAWRVW